MGGSGDENSEGSGAIGGFDNLKTIVGEVAQLIGSEDTIDDPTTLIGAFQAQFNKVEELLPTEIGYFESLLSSIQLCVSALEQMASAMSNVSGGSDSVTLNSGKGYKGTVGNAFAKGTVDSMRNLPITGYNGLSHDEKNALRSEYGQPELTVYPNGVVELTTEPTMSDLPKGTEIFNEEQTKRIMNNKGNILGNAYAKGTVIDKTTIPSYLRPLQEGDSGYALMKSFEIYQDMLRSQIIPPLNAIDNNMDMVARNISNVNNKTNNFSIGDITIHCTGVTSQEVAKQIGTEVDKVFNGMYLKACQNSLKR